MVQIVVVLVAISTIEEEAVEIKAEEDLCPIVWTFSLREVVKTLSAYVAKIVDLAFIYSFTILLLTCIVYVLNNVRVYILSLTL